MAETGRIKPVHGQQDCVQPAYIQPNYNFIESRLFARHRIRGLFSLRNGGISPAPFDSLNFGSGLGDAESNITCNLKRFIASTRLPGIPHQAIQTHQTGTLWCKGSGQTHNTAADILLSDQSDTPLAVRTADCLPVLLADPESGISAAVHAGWRGTSAGVVKQAIQSMTEHGAKPEHILACLGPCIGSCCFNIGEEAASALKNSAESAHDFVHNSADLRQINRLQLLQQGLSERNIELIEACNACDTKHFFSFRRDAGQTGRHLAIVAATSKP